MSPPQGLRARMGAMPLYRYSSGGLEPVDRTSLAREKIRERRDLQRALRERIDVLGDDLLVVAEEYAMFADSWRRIDLLALDRAGTLVVIELKRTERRAHGAPGAPVRRDGLDDDDRAAHCRLRPRT